MDALTNSDKRLIQSSLDRTIANLKKRRAALDTDYHSRVVSKEKRDSGRAKLSAKIHDYLVIKQLISI
jgi:hypothetical protein